jgi:vitamin B12 transport system substrate-binding protein
LILLLLILLLFTVSPIRAESKQQRIVSLSPHLTEMVFALGRENQLVGVSDYSDFPYSQGCIDEACTAKLPSVASYQGADIAAIIRLKPTIILAWDGGNKAQDIARLKQLGYPVFASAPVNIEALMEETLTLGKMLNAVKLSLKLHANMNTQIQNIKSQYANESTDALYYMNEQPLTGMGSDEWINSLLSLCNINNIYAELPTAYAQFSLADIIRKQPEVVIAATHQELNSVNAFWAPHQQVYQPTLVTANPDALHRFTPRALVEVAVLCKKVHF